MLFNYGKIYIIYYALLVILCSASSWWSRPSQYIILMHYVDKSVRCLRSILRTPWKSSSNNKYAIFIFFKHSFDYYRYSCAIAYFCVCVVLCGRWWYRRPLRTPFLFNEPSFYFSLSLLLLFRSFRPPPLYPEKN